MATKTTAKLLRVLKSDEPDFDATWQQFCERAAEISTDLDEQVRPTIESIRTGQDAALKAAVLEASGFRPARIEVTREEWDEGCEAVDPADRAAIGKAAMRIREFHRKRVPSSWEMREEGGAYMGHRVRPLARVGICVPSEGAVPSSVIMNTTPASVVEVPEIVLSAPPREDGSVAPELLIAARVSGVHRVFKMGGAAGIAALAYGTPSVSRVDRIVGAGDLEIEAAKRLVSAVVGVTAQTRAREVCIVADKSATPAWLAADLLSQAEHGELAHTVFITHYKGIVTRVQEQLTRQLKALGKTRVIKQALSARGIAVVTRNLHESIEIADRYAPEHLVLAVDAPELASKQVQNAGSIFLGHYTPVAVGDYLAGPNHVLPTGGSARFGSPLGVEDFLKRTSFVKFEPPKLRELGAEVVRLAQVEGLSGHGTSVELRLQKIRRARREREAAREAEL
jgi:histidinol dehydrogenase